MNYPTDSAVSDGFLEQGDLTFVIIKILTFITLRVLNIAKYLICTIARFYIVKEDPNILLIIMDCVRSSNTTMYGYDKDTTPFLDSFSTNEATLYKNAWAPSTWSLPSHTSIFSGYHTEEHKVISDNDKIRPEESIFYQLSEKGYSTGLFTDNVWVSNMNQGLSSGFDHISSEGRLPYPEGINTYLFRRNHDGYIKYLKECIKHENTYKSILNGFMTKLNDNKHIKKTISSNNSFYYADQFNNWINNVEGKWAACINFMDAHTPYEPQDNYNLWSDDEAMRIQDEIDRFSFYNREENLWKLKSQESLYDGSIRQIDATISELIDNLKRNNMYDNTYIVITSDHGEGFGEYNSVSEHRSAYHNPAITESVLSVPLITKEPYQSQSRVENGLASITDFKKSVNSILDGSSIKGDFTDDVVISSHIGLNENKREKLNEIYADRNLGSEKGRVAYLRDDNNRIIKFMQWENREGVEIIKPNSVSCENTKDINSIFEDKINEDLDVRIDSDSDIDANIENRLENLGYK